MRTEKEELFINLFKAVPESQQDDCIRQLTERLSLSEEKRPVVQDQSGRAYICAN